MIPFRINLVCSSGITEANLETKLRQTTASVVVVRLGGGGGEGGEGGGVPLPYEYINLVK